MSQMTIQKPMKRRVIRNRGKRARIGSHGFKVYKNTYVYIGKATESKSAVSPDLVETIQDLWNNNPSTKKMRKFIKGITIKRHMSPNHGGMWYTDKRWYEHIQGGNGSASMYLDDHIGTFYHEVEGHAFWDFSRYWRRELLIKFNELANEMPPVNEYVKRNQIKWRMINDERGRAINKNTPYHGSMTRYANEQHSAITEIVRGVPPARPLCMKQSDIDKLVKLWEELHY